VGCWIRRASLFTLCLCMACGPSEPAPVLDLPPRPAGAPGGTEVARDVRALGLEAREDRIYAEIARGNVPTRIRQLVPIEMKGEISGREHQMTFWATPDYLAVGSDEDHLLIPLSPQMAQRVADLVGGSLPTPRMVDAVWAAAEARLAPQRIQPSDSIGSIRTVGYFERHNDLIGALRRLHHVPPDAFVAGHKKDIVISSTLATSPGKVAIYGWHRPDGIANQPLSTNAPDAWVAYMHGVRLVDRDILVDGVRDDLLEVLRDPELAPVLSHEGVIVPARYPVLRGEKR